MKPVDTNMEELILHTNFCTVKVKVPLAYASSKVNEVRGKPIFTQTPEGERKRNQI